MILNVKNIRAINLEIQFYKSIKTLNSLEDQ